MSDDRKKSQPELSIIITSYKNPAVLRLCLESLKKNVLCEDYDILVADSATEENTEILMREEFPDISFFPHAKNLGFAKLLNIGLKNARGNYILILNADIIIEKRSVDLLLEYLKKNPDIGIVGPTARDPHGPPALLGACPRPRRVPRRLAWSGRSAAGSPIRPAGPEEPRRAGIRRSRRRRTPPGRRPAPARCR